MEREGKFRLRSEGHEETTPVRTLSEIHENVIYERLCDIEEKQRKWIETSKTLGNPQSEKEGEEQREWIRSVTFRGTNQYTPKKGGNTHVKVITPPLKSAITPPRRSAVTPPQKGRLTPPQTGVITPKSSTLGYFNVPNLKLHASHVPATSIEPLAKPDAEFISDDGKLVKILKIEAPPVVLRPTRDTTPKKPKPNTSHSINKSEINKMSDFDGKSTDSLITRLNLEIEKVDKEEKKIEKMIKEKKSPSKHMPTTPKKIVVPEKDECVKPSPPKVKTYDVKVTRDFIRQKQKEREERALEEKKKKEIETEEKKKKLIELKETQKRILRSCKRRMINDKPQWIGPLEVVAKDKKEKSPVRRPRSRETPKLHMNYSNENVEKMRQKAETVRNVFLKSNEQEPENLISIPGELENSIVEPDDFQHEIVKNVKKKRNKDSPMKDGDCVRKEKRQKTHKMGAKSYFEAAPWENPLSNKEVKKEDRPVTPDWLKELAEQPDPFNLINTFKRKLRMVDVKENTNQVEINVIDEDLLNLSAERISRYALTTKKDEIATDSLKLSQSLDQLNLKYPQIEKDCSDADDATYNVEKVETKNVLVSVNFDDFKAKNKENATQTSVPLMPYNLVTSSFLYPAFDYQPLYSSENGQIVQKVYAESVFSESSDSVSEIVQISRTLTKNRKKKMREEGAHGVMQVTSLRSSIHDPPFNFYDSASSADKNTTYTSVESYSQSNYEEKPLEMKIAKITTQVLEDMRETNPVQKSLDLRSNSSIQKAKEELEEMESVRLKLIEKGKDIEASSLKKRERALMLKLYQDLKEIARLRKLEKAKVNETESIANQMKVLKEKEETLKERQKNVEAIVAWKQRLEQEEQKIKKIESVIAHSPFNSPLPITFPRTIDRGTSPILGLNKPNLDSDNCSDSLERSSVSEHTLKNVTIRRHTNRVQYRRRSVGLNSPLTPRVTIMKRRNSTGSDESVTMSQNDTLSEQSDMESRVSALQHQLKERKIVLEKLKKEYNKSQRERLRAKEQSLLNQIQAYDSYIEQIKTDLQNEMEKDNVKVTKPQIKQPKFEKKKTKIEEKSELETKLKLDKLEYDKIEESETSQSKTLKPNETEASGLISASEFLIDSKSKIETENIKTSLEMGEIGKDATLKSVSEIIQTKDSQDTSLVSVSEIDQIEYSKSMSEILQSLIQESSLRSINENTSDNKTLKSVSEEKTLKSVSEEKTLKSVSEEKTLKSVSEEKTLKTPSEVLKTLSDKTLRTASVETPKTVSETHVTMSETQKTEETLKTGSVETPETGSGDVEKSSGETPKTESGETLKASREDLETSSRGRSHTVSGEIVKTLETPETAEELKTNEEATQTSKVEILTVSREIPKVASEETKTLSEKSNIETLESISENLKSIQDEMEPEETNQSKLTDSSSPTLISETMEKFDSNRESVSEYLPTMKSESESKRSISNLLSEEENCRVGELEIDSGDMSKVIEMFGNGFGLEDKLWKENMDASEQMEKTPLLNALQREREKAINVDFLTQSICAEVINDATDATVEAYNKKKKFAEKYNERWNRGDGPWNEGLTPQAIREAEELRKKQLQIEQEIEQLEAQEVVPYFYMREIPNKPPPPYTPPKFLPPTKEEIISRVSDAIEILWDESLKGNDILDIKSPSNYLSDIQDKSYVEFMFDLSKELFLKFKPKKVEASLPWIEKPMSKPLPPIRSKSDMLKYVENETEVVFGFKPKIMRENMIMKWSRKKRDLVDEILVRDLQDEEFEWTNFTLEENLVKNQISDSIADFMISEAAEGLKEAFLKKIVNFR